MPRFRVEWGAAAALLICACLPAPAGAAEILVSTTADGLAADGQCGLREAVNAAGSDTAANGCPAGSGADTIVLPAGAYFVTLPGSGEDVNASGDLDVAGEVTITGAGAAATTIDANGHDRAFHVLSGAAVTIRGVTITGGRTPAGAAGADALSGDPNTSAEGGQGTGGSSGGGILNAGTLIVDATTVRGNVAGGGGDGGDATGAAGLIGLPGGTAFGGKGGAGGSGGGIASVGGASVLTVTGSLITDNVAGAGGTGGDGLGGSGSTPLGGMFGVNGSAGGDAFAHEGGRGGVGGGISCSGTTVIAASAISANRAGDGGASGSSTGGRGGNAYTIGVNTGGVGGQARLVTIASATGGSGGGVSCTGTLALSDSNVLSNRAGDGGAGRPSVGGAGGSGNASGSGGDGGATQANFGSTGGLGGGVFTQVAGTIDRVTVAGNRAGNGGAGGAGTGGAAGAGGTTGLPGAIGAGVGTSGGDGGFGGGVHGLFGLSLSTSTVDANRAGDGGLGGAGSGGPGSSGSGGGRGGSGAGVSTFGNTLEIAGTTITDNVHGQPGASTAPFTGTGPLGIGGAIFKATMGPVSMTGSVIAGNLAPSCSSADGFSSDSNLHHPADIGCPGIEGDPQLASLADNGGPTTTRAPAADSPVLDRFACGGVDQRGVARPFGASCDFGAYERAAPAVLPAVAEAGATTAMFRAEVNPNARATTVFFDFGPTQSYGSTTAPQTVAAGLSRVIARATAAGLKPATTYHFRVRATNADGTTAGPDQAFTTAAAVADRTKPSLTGLRADPPTFAVAKRSSTATAAKAKKVAIGTTLRFRLSEAATVRLVFARKAIGVRSGGKCRPSRRAPSRSRRCTRFVAAGSVSRKSNRGVNAFRFTGRVGSKALARGAYRLTATARDAAGNRGRAVTAGFKVVAAPRRR